MNRSKVDVAWNLLSLAVVEILNPLLLISTALFVSIGYILYGLIPVTVDIWAALLALSIVIPLCLLTARARSLWKQGREHALRFSWRWLLAVLPILILLPPAAANLLRPTIYTIAHLDWPVPFITQVFLGTSPYESVIVPGNPSNQYWLLYLFIGAVVRVSALDIFSAWILVNVAFFVSAPLWIAKTLVTLNLARNQTLRLGLLTLFCFAAVNLTAILTLMPHLLTGTADLSDKSLILLDGADSRARAVGSLVTSGRGVTSSITAFTAVIYFVVNLLRDRIDRYGLVLISAAGIVSLAFMPIVALYIFVSVAGALLLTALFSLAKSPERKQAAFAYARNISTRIGPGFLLLWVLVSLALALPVLKYVLDFTSGLRTSVSLVLVDVVNVRKVIGSFLLLLPVAGLQVLRALRGRCATQRFLAFCAIIGLLLALTIDSIEDNQSKFHFNLAANLALLALMLVQDLRARRGLISTVLRVYVYALVFLALVNAAYYSLYSTMDRLGGSQDARFEGIRVYTTEDFGGRRTAYYWIHDHSPHDAIVLVPHVYSTRSKLFHGRLNYVSRGGKIYADYLPGYDQRVEQLHEFYNSETSPEDYLVLLESMENQLPGRPLYAVVMDPELSRETMAQRGAQLVFEKPPYGAHVYLLNPPVAS